MQHSTSGNSGRRSRRLQTHGSGHSTRTPRSPAAVAPQEHAARNSSSGGGGRAASVVGWVQRPASPGLRANTWMAGEAAADAVHVQFGQPGQHQHKQQQQQQQQQEEEDRRRCCGCISRTWCTVLLAALLLLALCGGGAGLWVWFRGRATLAATQGGCSGQPAGCAPTPPPMGSQLLNGEDQEGCRNRRAAVLLCVAHSSSSTPQRQADRGALMQGGIKMLQMSAFLL
jgi:hypothetical protein